MPRNYVLHPKLRLRGMKTRRTLTTQIVRTLRHGVVFVALVLGLLFTVNSNVLSAAIEVEQRVRSNVEEVIVSCLNHGAAYFNNSLHLCRPRDVWIEKGKDLK